MSQLIEVKVPDIGDFSDVPVIEVFVKPGDTVKADESLITLESDKATMDVPSPAAGTVKEVKVNQRQKPTLDGAFVSLGKIKADKEIVLTIQTTGTDGHVIADAVQAIPVK